MDDTVWKISEVNSAVKNIIEGGFAPFWLEGEIGTLTVHRSGHVYLVLKDNKSQIRAVFWKGAGKVKELGLETGAKIEALGRLTVYEVRGEYQFNIQAVRPVGLGNLQKKFEEIKKQLDSEGLFDQSRKKPIPVLPRVIGVVTSATGAAIRDFLNIVNRRFPNIRVQIYSASVQGKGAEKEVAEGIKFFNSRKNVDVIVITRGGGSMEDLWAFNDEMLARTIADSSIPIISAVGHEIDFTICDFVSDLRVPTPSAAAELVIGHQDELNRKVFDLEKRLKHSLELYFEKTKRRFETLANSYVFQDPLRIIYEKQQNIDELMLRMKHILNINFEKNKNRIQTAVSRLQSLNPKSVLSRGYSILKMKSTGKIITSPDIDKGVEVSAVLKDGELDLVVK